MGYWTAASDVVVTHASGPGRYAKHGLWSFERDPHDGQAFIERVFEESGRRFTYIGEWHTHLWGRLTPSHRDLRTMRGIPEEPHSYQERPLLIIHSTLRSRVWPACRGYILRDGELVEQHLYFLHLSPHEILRKSASDSVPSVRSPEL
jgi:integrative and conjugative element protein (TIGR02256 family)